MTDLSGGRRPHLWIAATLVAAATLSLAFGWQMGQETQQSALAPAAEAWSLPQPQETAPGQDMAEITTKRPWAAEGRAAGMGAIRPDAGSGATGWRLAGTVQRGDQQFALIARGTALEYKRVGDSLPDGSIILQINQDGVITDGGSSSPDKKTRHTLFGTRK